MGLSELAGAADKTVAEVRDDLKVKELEVEDVRQTLERRKLKRAMAGNKPKRAAA